MRRSVRRRQRKTLTIYRAAGSQQICTSDRCWRLLRGAHLRVEVRSVETKSLDATVCRTRVDNTCKFMYDLVRMDKTTADGDSGGPALYGGKAYGIVTAKDPNNGNKMVYSAINEVESTLGVYTCTTAAC
jgi:hypothetical protein